MKKVIGTFIILTTITLNIMAQQKIVQTAGRTQMEEFATDAQEILPGTVIHIPANVKHWHGAAKDSWFAHLAFEIPGENTSNEWLEAVSDEEYNKLK